MDWDECYRIGETPWDLGSPAPPLLGLLEQRPATIWGEGPVLVPGCGRGHDAVALHEAGREVLALDLAPSALAEARALHGAREGLSWQLGDFFDPDLAAQHQVGSIFEHTCFCAIPPSEREAYVSAAARWLRPGHRLVAVFFLDPPQRDDGEEGPPYGVSREEIRGLFAGPFSIDREGAPSRAHPQREGREWIVELIRNF